MIDNKDFLAALQAEFPEAIGGEMEGAGVQAAAHREATEWLVAKDSVPACVRVIALVPCGPLGETPDSQELRDRFLAWLAGTPAMMLIGDLRPGQQGVTWKSWATPRRSSLRADLTGEDQAKVPVASAVLELPSDGVRLAGTDPRYAELIVHVDLPATDFGRGLPDWRRRLTEAVSMPGELAQFLQDLGLPLPSEPPAQVGVLLRGRRSLTEIVSPGNIPVLSASSTQIVPGLRASSLRGPRASLLPGAAGPRARQRAGNR